MDPNKNVEVTERDGDGNPTRGETPDHKEVEFDKPGMSNASFGHSEDGEEFAAT